jgi:hypothetical protein
MPGPFDEPNPLLPHDDPGLDGLREDPLYDRQAAARVATAFARLQERRHPGRRFEGYVGDERAADILQEGTA